MMVRNLSVGTTMRRAPAGTILSRMTIKPGHQILRVELDLAVGQEPICGRLRGARGAEAPFTGWLELIQIIDQLCASPPDGAERRAEPRTHT